MNSAIDSKFSSCISFDEILTLNKILSKYDFEVTGVEGVRSAFKVTTSKGVFCMKKIGKGHSRALKAYYIIEHLNSKGFFNTLKYYPTKDGTIFIRNKKSTYYLTWWIEGRESSFNNLKDILKSAEFLSQFHVAAKGIESAEHIKIRYNYRKTSKELQQKIKDMERIKRHIELNPEKDLFDFIYLDNLPDNIEEARNIVQTLKDMDLEEYLVALEEEKYVCHDSFYYQNILIDKDDKLNIIDLESCVFGMPMIDLGSYIRRIVTKSKYAWDFDMCRKIIECYEKNRQLSKLELELLYLIVMFPHKYWRLGKKRYIKRKNWSDRKYERKLKKQLELGEYKKEFSECYRSFYGLDETTGTDN